MTESIDPLPQPQKTLILINTGSPKKRFILQKLKKMPVKVVVVHKEKNWAAPYLDEWLLADTSRHDLTIKIVEEYAKKNQVDGVITFWEDDVILTAKIAEKLKLIGVPVEVARQARNKFAFRQFCESHSLPAPKFRQVRNAEEVRLVAQELQFPVVIKPRFGSSSAFVVKAHTLDELESAYSYIASNISVTTESALKEGEGIFVEEYIDGDEVDIDLLLQNGKVKFASVADNYATTEPFFVETTHSLPSNLEPEDQADLIRVAEETLEKLGVMHGCIHFEAKFTATGPVPLEANLRMGGDEVYISAKEVWGVDLIEGAVAIALGEYLPSVKTEEPRRYLMTQTLQAQDSGVVSSLHVDKEVLKQAKVEQLYFDKEVGDPILVPPEGYEYLGWLTVSGDTFPDAQDNLQKALKAIQFEIVKFDPGSVIGRTNRKHRFAGASIAKSLILGAAQARKLQRLSKTDQRKLHIGIACNAYESSGRDAVQEELASVGNNIQRTLSQLGYTTTYIDFNDLSKALDILQKTKLDLVFNVCERINHSSLLEPHAAGFFDAFQIPYTGSNPLTLGLCIDKIRVKKLLNYHTIPTPKWDYAYSLDDEISEELRYPLIVKPANSDNSIGITNDSVVIDKKQLRRQLEYVITDLKQPALVEEYIEGDEYDVAIIGNEPDDLQVLPLSRTIFDNLPEGYWHIYPFEAKYGEDAVFKRHIEVQEPPKNLPRKLSSLISEIALDTYNILDCHDYGRVEIKVDRDNNPYVLELNSNPSINIGDCLPRVSALSNMDYGEFLERIISLAVKRYQGRPAYYHLVGNLL